MHGPVSEGGEIIKKQHLNKILTDIRKSTTNSTDCQNEMREQILIDLLIYTVGSKIRKKTTSHNGMPHQISVTKKNTLIQGFLIKSTGQLQIKIC